MVTGHGVVLAVTVFVSVITNKIKLIDIESIIIIVELNEFKLNISLITIGYY